MKITQFIGALMVAAPFIATTALMIHDIGWLPAMAILGILAAVFACCAIGFWLLDQ